MYDFAVLLNLDFSKVSSTRSWMASTEMESPGFRLILLIAIETILSKSSSVISFVLPLAESSAFRIFSGANGASWPSRLITFIIFEILLSRPAAAAATGSDSIKINRRRVCQRR